MIASLKCCSWRLIRALPLIALGLAHCPAAFAQSELNRPGPPAHPTPQQAGSNRAIDIARMLVLDASGSMWKNVEQNNDKSPRRAELAAQFVGTFTAQLATERNQHKLGMVRLGYQYSWLNRTIPRETLCKDVELVVPPLETAAQAQGRVARESGFGRSVDDNDYNPKGQTPLELAIESAANAAPPDGGTLVVVTDLEPDDKCLPDPCGPDGQPIAKLQRLLKTRKVNIRYVIAAGLIGAIGERAKRFAACFGAEYRVLETLDQADKLGAEVARHLMDEAPPPAVAVHGSLKITVQDEDGRKLDVPLGGQIDLKQKNTGASVLHAPGQMAADPGHYESSLQIGTTRLQVDDAEVSPNHQTEIAFVLAPANLRIRLIDSDGLPIDNEPNTVWEIEANPSQPQNRIMRFKGTFLNQMLPAGSYSVRVYASGREFDKNITLAPAQQLEISVKIGPS
jgi:hypothetical protein